MTTVNQVINRAFEQAGVKDIRQTLDSEDLNTGLSLINDMLSQWEDEGIDLNLSTLTNNATVYLDKGDFYAVKTNLALRACEHYRLPMTGMLLKSATDSFNTMLSKYVTVEEVEMPDSLNSHINSAYDITGG